MFWVLLKFKVQGCDYFLKARKKLVKVKFYCCHFNILMKR